MALSRIETWGAARRYAARLLANHWRACRSFVGQQGQVAAMQGRRQLSRGCWCEQSLQVRLGGSSSQCAPVAANGARWNDIGNLPPAIRRERVRVTWITPLWDYSMARRSRSSRVSQGRRVRRHWSGQEIPRNLSLPIRAE